MKLNIAICDDDKSDISRLTHMLESYYIAKDVDLKIDTFISGKALFEIYRKAGILSFHFCDKCVSTKG
ncbi:MAG: hypothetical protein NC347_04525, partial [Clostridium sp.]|nr:hypothetical protein [Clostridium sp.]